MTDPTAEAYPQPSVFEAMLAKGNLRAAWEKTRRNGGCAGGDGVTIGMFAAALEDNLELLADEIRNDIYVPGDHLKKAINKKRGGTRILSIPPVVDRIAQGALARVLRPLLEAEFEDCSYAYRPGRSVDMAARRVTELWQEGNDWVVEADIRAYFDNVPHASLLHRLSGLVPEDRVLRLVAMWLAAGGDDPAATGELGQGIGLPQGSPMSPHLANFYLDSLDERLKSFGFHLVRYADDFVLLSNSYATAQQGLACIREELGDMGLVLNPEKTRITRFSDGFDFLGRRFLRDHLREDPDGLDAEERAALKRWGESEARSVARGRPPEPQPKKRLFGKDFAQLRAADMLAPDGPDAPLVISAGAGEDAPEDDGTLFIQTEGAVLDARGGALAVSICGQEAWARTPRGVDRIEIAPGVVVTDPALRLAASKGLPLVWVSHAGIEVARTDAPLADRAGLHLAQARVALDPEAGLVLARVLAEGRIRSARQVLMGWRQDLRKKRYRATRESTREHASTVLERADRAIGPMRAEGLKCRIAANRAELLGLEGAAIARFFRVWRRSLIHTTVGARSRRPAVDAGNSVLNYLCALLQRDVEAAARRAGLHPGLGVYHQSRDYADALVYDLMEEFRAPVVEALARRMLNNREIGVADFYTEPNTGAVLMSPPARRRVIAAYRNHTGRKERKRADGGKQGLSWRGLMQAQSRRMVLAVTGEASYSPVLRGF